MGLTLRFHWISPTILPVCLALAFSNAPGPLEVCRAICSSQAKWPYRAVQLGLVFLLCSLLSLPLFSMVTPFSFQWLPAVPAIWPSVFSLCTPDSDLSKTKSDKWNQVVCVRSNALIWEERECFSPSLRKLSGWACVYSVSRKLSKEPIMC